MCSVPAISGGSFSCSEKFPESLQHEIFRVTAAFYLKFGSCTHIPAHGCHSSAPQRYPHSDGIQLLISDLGDLVFLGFLYIQSDIDNGKTVAHRREAAQLV